MNKEKTDEFYDFIKSYKDIEELGRLIKNLTDNGLEYYLPHHAGYSWSSDDDEIEEGDADKAIKRLQLLNIPHLKKEIDKVKHFFKNKIVPLTKDYKSVMKQKSMILEKSNEYRKIISDNANFINKLIKKLSSKKKVLGKFKDESHYSKSESDAVISSYGFAIHRRNYDNAHSLENNPNLRNMIFFLIKTFGDKAAIGATNIFAKQALEKIIPEVKKLRGIATQNGLNKVKVIKKISKNLLKYNNYSTGFYECDIDKIELFVDESNVWIRFYLNNTIMYETQFKKRKDIVQLTQFFPEIIKLFERLETKLDRQSKHNQKIFNRIDQKTKKEQAILELVE